MTKREQREQATFDVCGLRKTVRERERRQRRCRFAVALNLLHLHYKQAVKVLNTVKQAHVCVYTVHEGMYGANADKYNASIHVISVI